MDKYNMKKFNTTISNILHEAKSDISQLILNCYK